ncbi:MAG: 8-oxo-dGTP diphosphatase [Candidatus Microsaccharimonas sp.]
MKELTLLFLRRDNQILLAMKKRGFGEGRWNGVGGKLEEGESLEEALLREAKEEITVTPTTFKKVADITFDEFFKGQPALMHVHVFIATEWKGDPTESEEMKPKWFNIDNLPYDTIWTDDAYWLPKALAGKKIIATFNLDEQDGITAHTITEVTEF